MVPAALITQLARALLLLAALIWSASAGASPGSSSSERRGGIYLTPLCEEGERLPGAAVLGVMVHPEFHRYTLVLEDSQELQVEVVSQLRGGEGVCSRGLATLYPRWELLGRAIPEESARHLAVEALCRRLEGYPEEEILSAPPRESAPQPGDRAALVGAARAPAPLHGPLLPGLWELLAVSAAVCLWGMRRGRPPAWILAALTLGGGLRLLLGERGLFNGDWAGYQKLDLILRRDASEYGGGYGSLFGRVCDWLGGDPQRVFDLQFLLSLLSLWLFADLARRWLPPRAAQLAVLGAAVHPAMIWLSRSEVMHGLTLTLELLALWALSLTREAPRSWAPWLLCLSSTAAALSTRPDALPFVAVPVLWALLLHGRSLGLAGGLSLVGLLLLGAWQSLGLLSTEITVLRAEDYLRLHDWLKMLLPQLDPETHRVNVFLFVGFTPLLWTAGLFLALLPWSRREATPTSWLLGLSWAAFTLLPMLPKNFPQADALRFQLSAQPALLWLAAPALLRIAALLPSRRDLLHGAIAGAALIWGGTLSWSQRPVWAGHQTWAFLARSVPQLERGQRVLFCPASSRAGSFQRIMETLGPAAWDPLTEELSWPEDSDQVLLYQDLLSQLLPREGSPGRLAESPHCRAVLRCKREALEVQRVGPATDLDTRLTAPAEVGFYWADAACVQDHMGEGG